LGRRRDDVDILSQIDIEVFRFINSGCHSSVLDAVMPYITEIGGGRFIFAIAVVLLFLKRRDIKLTGVILLAGLTVCYQSVYILKNIIGRPRPFLPAPNAKTLLRRTGFPSRRHMRPWHSWRRLSFPGTSAEVMFFIPWP
jgi:hypothetical protein